MAATPRPVDTNVKIPAAVRAAADRANEFYKPAEPPTPPAAVEPPPVDPNAPPPPVVEPPTPVTPAGNPPTPPPAPVVPEESWEQRYKSMKGRFDRAENTVRELTTQIGSMQNLVATLQARPAPATPAPTPASRSITAEEEKEFGAEFLDVVGRQAKDILNPEVAAIKQEMKQLQDRLASVTGHVVQDARTRMLSELGSAVSDWKVMNDDPNFIAWLQLPDTYSGAIRHELLRAAYERNDSARVIAFFKGFLSEEAAVAPAVPGPNPPPADVTPPGKVPLQDLAAPGRAKTPAGGSPPVEKPTISRAQITQFYADVAAGKYRGRQEQKDALEKQIFEANASGRITN